MYSGRHGSYILCLLASPPSGNYLAKEGPTACTIAAFLPDFSRRLLTDSTSAVLPQAFGWCVACAFPHSEQCLLYKEDKLCSRATTTFPQPRSRQGWTSREPNAQLGAAAHFYTWQCGWQHGWLGRKNNGLMSEPRSGCSIYTQRPRWAGRAGFAGLGVRYHARARASLWQHRAALLCLIHYCAGTARTGPIAGTSSPHDDGARLQLGSVADGRRRDGAARSAAACMERARKCLPSLWQGGAVSWRRGQAHHARFSAGRTFSYTYRHADMWWARALTVVAWTRGLDMQLTTYILHLRCVGG